MRGLGGGYGWPHRKKGLRGALLGLYEHWERMGLVAAGWPTGAWYVRISDSPWVCFTAPSTKISCYKAYAG
jgi:hypothetical protein